MHLARGIQNADLEDAPNLPGVFGAQVSRSIYAAIMLIRKRALRDFAGQGRPKKYPCISVQP
jgi:hypothetical protein